MDLTYKQFLQSWLNNNKYKEKYLTNKELLKQKEQELQIVWVRELKKHAIEKPLKTKVIMSYIRLFGESSLFYTFRGIYENGISEFRIPKKIRNLRKII